MNSSFQIKKLEKQDVLLFQELILLFQTVFEEEKKSKVSSTYLQEFLNNPDFIVLCALSENKIIGGLTAYKLANYYEESAEAFIYDIAIDSNFQRQGVGKMLLSSLKEYCKQHKIKLMFVEAHEEDEHAIDFYRKAGGESEKVVHFNFDVNK